MSKPQPGFVRKPQAPRQLTAEEEKIINGAPNYNPAPQLAAPAAPPKVEEPTKRLSMDVPVSMHREMKRYCADHDTSIRDLVLKLLQDHFADHPNHAHRRAADE